MQYQIYWTPQTQLFELQGATIDFRSLNDVYYEHYFLPSGRVIATWRSNHHFQREKRSQIYRNCYVVSPIQLNEALIIVSVCLPIWLSRSMMNNIKN